MNRGVITEAGGQAARVGRRRRHRAGGFTLTELMVVVGIIALISAIAFFGFARPSASGQANTVARDLYFAMQRARLQATSDGRQYRVWLCRSVDSTCLTAGTWFTQRAASTGMQTPSGWETTSEQGLIARRDAWVDAIGTFGGSALGATANASVTFMPDGSAVTGSSTWNLVTVTDKSGATTFSLRVFAATGLVRLWQTK